MLFKRDSLWQRTFQIRSRVKDRACAWNARAGTHGGECRRCGRAQGAYWPQARRCRLLVGYRGG